MIKNLRVTVNGMAYDVQVEDLGGDNFAPVAAAPAAAPVAAAPAPAPAPAAPKAAPKAAPSVAGAEKVSAPMPGNILSVNVQPGDTVKSGAVLVVLEAMKMENEIMAPRDLTVAAVHVNKGDKVESGAVLVSFN